VANLSHSEGGVPGQKQAFGGNKNYKKLLTKTEEQRHV
jgi:hypothetical protein